MERYLAPPESLSVGDPSSAHHETATIAIVVLTYNREHLLRQCVEKVLERASERTTEILIWNNGSTDGTREYLDSLQRGRVRVVHWPTNIGQNAYDRAFSQTTAPYLLEVDDDIIDAPTHWDDALLGAFLKLPEFGYLAANLVNNPHDNCAQIMYGSNAHLYRIEEMNGVELKLGLTGGGCSLTSRELYDRVGGFGQNKLSFWHEDARYTGKIIGLGYQVGYLNTLRVLHAGGEYYAPLQDTKYEFWKWRERRQRRRTFVKRVLLRIPFVPRLNRRYGWFVAPED